MCDSQNLIDLTGWDEPKKEETAIEEAQGESAIVESTSFKGPRDPFDSIEEEACIKGLNLQDQVEKPETVAADIQLKYSDQDLNNETPPVAMLDSHPKKIQNSGQISTTSSVKYVDKLLQELKSLICEHVDQSIMTQFNVLSESISVAVHAIASSSTGAAREDVHHVSPGSPHTYKRQGTFDLDLEEHKRQSVESAEYAIGRKVQEFPDAMTCSSATFDGEPLASDKAAIPISIPIINIEEKSPKKFVDISSPQSPKSDSYVTEVINDNLALEINELLERHNLVNQHQDNSNPTETKYVGGQTVIIVVNSSTVADQLSSSTTRTMKPAAAATSSSSNTNKANTLKRRSSSLSIHDKSKKARVTKVASEAIVWRQQQQHR